MEKERQNFKIGIYLEKALRDAGMSIDELSKKTGIASNLIRRYIVNEKSPSLTNIKQIAAATGKDIEFFTEDTFYRDGMMRAQAFESTLMVNVKHGDPKSYKTAYKNICKMVDQIFNTVSDDGKEKIVEQLFLFLTTDLYPIVYEEKNPDKKYWSYRFTDSSALEEWKQSNLRTGRQLANLFSKDEEDEELDTALLKAVDKMQMQEEISKLVEENEGDGE